MLHLQKCQHEYISAEMLAAQHACRVAIAKEQLQQLYWLKVSQTVHACVHCVTVWQGDVSSSVISVLSWGKMCSFRQAHHKS